MESWVSRSSEFVGAKVNLVHRDTNNWSIAKCHCLELKQQSITGWQACHSTTAPQESINPIFRMATIISPFSYCHTNNPQKLSLLEVMARSHWTAQPFYLEKEAGIHCFPRSFAKCPPPCHLSRGTGVCWSLSQ
jgi:hypothetical protein